MAELPKAYKGLALPPNYDPVRTNHRVAGLFGGLEWYFKATGVLGICAGFINPFYLICSGLAFGISEYLRYEKNKTLEMADKVEAERELYYQDCERRMRDDLGKDISDKLP